MEVSQEHGEDAVDGREVGQGLVVILEGDHEVLQQITLDQKCQRCLTMFEWRVCAPSFYRKHHFHTFGKDLYWRLVEMIFANQPGFVNKGPNSGGDNLFKRSI